MEGPRYTHHVPTHLLSSTLLYSTYLPTDLLYSRTTLLSHSYSPSRRLCAAMQHVTSQGRFGLLLCARLPCYTTPAQPVGVPQFTRHPSALHLPLASQRTILLILLYTTCRFRHLFDLPFLDDFAFISALCQPPALALTRSRPYSHLLSDRSTA